MENDVVKEFDQNKDNIQDSGGKGDDEISKQISFNKAVGSKVKEPKNYLKDMNEMSNLKGYSRIYRISMSVPIGLRHFLFDKFSSCYSCTIDKAYLGKNFFSIITCLFAEETDYLEANIVKVTVGGKSLTLKSEQSTTVESDKTQKGIYTPLRVKKVGLREVPWHLSNYTSLSTVFKDHFSFSQDKMSLVLDKSGRFTGSISIIVNEFFRIPNEDFKMKNVDSDGTILNELLYGIKIRCSGYSSSTTRDDKVIMCSYCRKEGHVKKIVVILLEKIIKCQDVGFAGVLVALRVTVTIRSRFLLGNLAKTIIFTMNGAL